jgi:hypothetical protein
LKISPVTGLRRRSAQISDCFARIYRNLGKREDAFCRVQKNMTLKCLQCLIKKCNVAWLCSGVCPVDRYKAAPGGNQNHE